MDFQVLTTSPDTETSAKWNAFLERAAFATHYVTPNFFIDPFIRGGERFVVLALDDQAEIAAVLSGIMSGRKIASGLAVRPQIAFRRGVDRLAAAKALLAALDSLGRQKPELIELHSWEPIPEFEQLGFQMERSQGANLVIMIDLEQGADNIFKAFSQTRRNEIRKALRLGLVEVKSLETEDELRQLYDIHVDWNLRKGNVPDSFENMRLAAEQRDNRIIFIAKTRAKVIAGSYYRFCRGGVVEYAANNSLVEFQKLRPNDLIGWRSIEWACENGFSQYSMGGSHLFLRRFGGQAVSTCRYRLDRSFLHMHDLQENFRRMLIRGYQRIPANVRSRMKKVAA